jgi:hypothetical protein
MVTDIKYYLYHAVFLIYTTLIEPNERIINIQMWWGEMSFKNFLEKENSTPFPHINVLLSIS